MELHKYLSQCYYKSNLIVDDTDYVYIDKIEFDWADRKYETFIDSKGNAHQVQTDYKLMKIKFEDSQFEYRDGFLHHDKSNIDNVYFQHHLKRYLLIIHKWKSAYKEVSRIHWDWWSDFSNRSHSQNHNYKGLYKNLRNEKYFPLFENVFIAGNNQSITNYIPDKMFFDIEDRELATNRLSPQCKRMIIDDGYLEMDDPQLFKYLKQRLKDKINYTRTYNNTVGTVIP